MHSTRCNMILAEQILQVNLRYKLLRQFIIKLHGTVYFVMNSTKFMATGPLQWSLRDKIHSISQVGWNNCQLKFKYIRILPLLSANYLTNENILVVEYYLVYFCHWNVTKLSILHEMSLFVCARHFILFYRVNFYSTATL